MGRNLPIDRENSALGLAICILASCLPAMSLAADDESKKCEPGIYCVEQMLCIGRLDGTPPQDMNPNFFVELLTLRSAKLVRKDKTLADGLMMDNVPVGNDHPNVMMEEAKSLVDWTVGQFGPPARIKDNRHVSTNWNTIGFSDGMSLTIDAAEPRGSYRFDMLSGSESFDGTAGRYKLNYQCVAKVVDAPSLVTDEK